ncbi:MAG: glycerol-3-phosphate dehydrogenase/oxidase, partial [Ardenticatenaceae bacterium]
PILYPIYRGDKHGLFKMTAGMWAYDALSLFRNVKRHKIILANRVDKVIPGLRARDLTGVARFYDARTHDARLTLANAQQAHDAHTTLLTYARVLGFLRDEGGRLAGVRICDELSGHEYELHARLLLNCTGPWTDRVIQMADPGIPPRLSPSKGVHLVFDRQRLPLDDEALYLAAPQDGRPVFVIPWENVTIVGTTDTFYEGSLDEVPVTDDDVAYLLEVTNYAFPGANLTAEDVQSSWAGLRPLLIDPGAQNEGATSREHDIWEAPRGLVSIAGGKLTTYRVMGRQLIDVAAEKLAGREGIAPKRAAATADLPLPGAEYPLPSHNPTSLPGDVWAHLVRSYGTYARDVARQATADSSLAERIIGGLPYIWAELPHAVQFEQCLTAEDFLARRTWLIYDAPQRGAEVLDEVIQRMAALLGWDASRCEH